MESIRLRAYRALEEAMVELDDTGDEVLADAIRDALDPIWYALTEAERDLLNERTFTGVNEDAGLSVTLPVVYERRMPR